jgi:pyruvate,water dikinase
MIFKPVTKAGELMAQTDLIRHFEEISLTDLDRVGGKNASLGEMQRQLSGHGIRLAPGFATTADMFRDYVQNNQLQSRIDSELATLSTGDQSLSATGSNIREAFLAGHFSDDQVAAITQAYARLCDQCEAAELAVAVRSSATAEDLPEASFAGQQESYLNMRGIDSLLEACRRCFASLYTDRAISYREQHGFAHTRVALSVGVQQMVEADAAGVMFSIDTESGFPKVVSISANWGLGETVVNGSINPDRYMIFKPLLERPGKRPIIEKTLGSKLQKLLYGSDSSQPTRLLNTSDAERQRLVLNDDELLQLAQWAVMIERHYGKAMDMEWARDTSSGDLFILQARPETVESARDQSVLESYSLNSKGPVLVEGASVGSAVVVGTVCHAQSALEVDRFPPGAILVTERTDPDWLPIMRKAGGVVTDRGGPTSHAAIVSRELKLPAIVGTGNATTKLSDGQEVTVSCAGGATGQVFAGALEYEVQAIALQDLPATRTDIMINAAMPDGALRWWQLSVAGIGLARIEFIISSQIRAHPMALLHPERVEDSTERDQIEVLTRGYERPGDYFIELLALGVGKIAASQWPLPVIVRTSDFKSNEYRGLLGGSGFEPLEENPMLGLRGASRYYHPSYEEAFRLECQALKYARDSMGFDNIIVMIPFCRTPQEADRVLEIMACEGLQRGKNGFQVYVMCEIPSNVILAEQFAERFDGFSIGSNDLTQLVLGVDRDSAELESIFDARNEAVKRMISDVIRIAHEHDRKVGICGQAPSDHPEFAAFLVNAGIDSISLNPDSVPAASAHIADAEQADRS